MSSPVPVLGRDASLIESSIAICHGKSSYSEKLPNKEKRS